jgi:2-phospho-L-lactate/phosphoenolpyruvate guanylyltransferase
LAAVRTLAVLPVKDFSRAKQRLRSGLDPQAREDLAEAMLEDVLDALELANKLEAVLVVTDGPGARSVAERHRARVIEDHAAGHNAAAQQGVDAVLAAGGERALLVPGDCPALEPGEVDQLLDRTATSPSALIVPDRHGTGTNALLLTPPDALAPSFGPGSCARHLEHARAAGLDAEVVHVPSLALDIDTPDDLGVLANVPERARRTLALLARC